MVQKSQVVKGWLLVGGALLLIAALLVACSSGEENKKEEPAPLEPWVYSRIETDNELIESPGYNYHPDSLVADTGSFLVIGQHFLEGGEQYGLGSWVLSTDFRVVDPATWKYIPSPYVMGLPDTSYFDRSIGLQERSLQPQVLVTTDQFVVCNEGHLKILSMENEDVYEEVTCDLELDSCDGESPAELSVNREDQRLAMLRPNHIDIAFTVFSNDLQESWNLSSSDLFSFMVNEPLLADYEFDLNLSSATADLFWTHSGDLMVMVSDQSDSTLILIDGDTLTPKDFLVAEKCPTKGFTLPESGRILLLDGHSAYQPCLIDSETMNMIKRFPRGYDPLVDLERHLLVQSHLAGTNDAPPTLAIYDLDGVKKKQIIETDTRLVPMRLFANGQKLLARYKDENADMWVVLDLTTESVTQLYPPADAGEFFAVSEEDDSLYVTGNGLYRVDLNNGLADYLCLTCESIRFNPSQNDPSAIQGLTHSDKMLLFFKSSPKVFVFDPEQRSVLDKIH